MVVIRRNPKRFLIYLEEVRMSYIKTGIIAVAAFAICAPSVAQAQGYKQQGTRRGALAGAIIGGLIGASNDEALAGAAIGGVIGGVTGRAVGRNRDAQYRSVRYGGGGQGYYQQPNYYRGGQRGYSVQYVPARSYRTNYGGGGYGRGYGGGGRGYGGSYCPNRGW